MSEELDCTYCQNLERIDDELPTREEPLIVRKYYKCRADVFATAFTKKELIDHYSVCTVRIEITGHGNVDELLSEIDTLSIIFQRISGNNTTKIIKVDVHAAAALASPCISQSDYFSKIAFLAGILELDISDLRQVTKQYEQDWKGVKLLKQYLEEHALSDQSSFDMLEAIIRLRNKTYPAHRLDSGEVSVIMKGLGLSYPVVSKPEWQKNWDATLSKFTSALRKIRINLQKTIT